ncbi:MAG: hypothetical protein JXR46_15675 [Calditrichaceae bacterium]|nr:hypothetical protein [Calditrichaceae bacterium]MBN2710484.1 hypothetical protein [Calditrichaceae bacterium]RQV97275.1 MAG: hypothetical protein EH224_01655 [Calditrichota bacterium]
MNDPLIPVYSPINDSEKLIILSLLEESQIEYTVENQNNQDLFGIGRFGGYNYITGPERILVKKSQISDAKSIIGTLKYSQIVDITNVEDDLTELKLFNFNLNAAVIIGILFPGFNIFNLINALKIKISSKQELKGGFRIIVSSIFFLVGLIILISILQSLLV